MKSLADRINKANGEVLRGWSATVDPFRDLMVRADSKLKALGVTSLERSPLLPDIATADEQGVKGYTSYNWNGVLAPAGTPRPIVDRIHGVLAKALSNPETRKLMEAIGYEVSGDGTAEYAAFIKSKKKKWGKVARRPASN
jgi:tripartite-type tricarboxylate transporter receptor subunit TctC